MSRLRAVYKLRAQITRRCPLRTQYLLGQPASRKCQDGGSCHCNSAVRGCKPTRRIACAVGGAAVRSGWAPMACSSAPSTLLVPIPNGVAALLRGLGRWGLRVVRILGQLEALPAQYGCDTCGGLHPSSQGRRVGGQLAPLLGVWALEMGSRLVYDTKTAALPPRSTCYCCAIPTACPKTL